MSTPVALYRHFDADGQLLYVGITGSLEKRTQSHVETSSWAASIAKTAVDYFPTRKEALDAERRAIQTEGPVHNRSCAPLEESVFCCPDVEAFAKEVAEFADTYGYTPSTVLQMATRASKTWRAINSGKDLRMGTAYRVRLWMRDFAAKATS